MVKPFQKIAVIGLGLIGSSITRGAKLYGLGEVIKGFDSNPDVRALANKLDIGADISKTLEEAVGGADLVIMAVPVGAIFGLAKALSGLLKPGSILTDVGSVKGRVTDQVLEVLSDKVSFVPGHPVAGTEQSGPEAGFATLFKGRWCILTPVVTTPVEDVQKVRAFWQGLGSLVEEMEAGHHDMVLAITSHIPHLIAYNIVGTAADLEDVSQSEVIKFSAGGFRDFTRIAASDPVMWRDVFMNNQTAVLEMLGRFTEDLTELQKHIRRGNGRALEDLFEKTRTIRRSIVDAGQETDKPDFGREFD